jgi:hypothetical protein
VTAFVSIPLAGNKQFWKNVVALTIQDIHVQFESAWRFLAAGAFSPERATLRQHMSADWLTYGYA